MTAPAVCLQIQTPRPPALWPEACDFDFGSRQGPFEGPATRKASGSAGGYLLFDVPQRIRRIWLVFEETEAERTQEFVLRWFSDGGHSFREIVRQQWNFSPPDATRETEDYRVDLSGVTVLELVIVPDKSRGAMSHALLKSLRLA